MGELETKTEFVAPAPSYPPSALSRKTRYETMIWSQQNNKRMSLSRKLNHVELQINAVNPTDINLIMDLDGQKSDIENKIMKVDYDIASDVEVPLSKEEKGEWRQEQKTCGDRATKHVQHQQKAYATIIGQCTQHLQDKLHDDGQWETVNQNQKPLELCTLIEKVVMQQTGDEYPASNLVDNSLAVLTLKQQNNQSNTQWYEKLNMQVDVEESVGVEFNNFTSLWEYCCKARGWGNYDSLTNVENNRLERFEGETTWIFTDQQ